MGSCVSCFLRPFRKCAALLWIRQCPVCDVLYVMYDVFEYDLFEEEFVLLMPTKQVHIVQKR